MKKLLIVIDMQEDFVRGTLANPAAEAIIPKIKTKIDSYLKENNTVIFTRDTHSVDYFKTPEGIKLPIEHCIKDTKGWLVVDELCHPECLHINKPTFGYKHWDFECLDNYDTIELVGTCTSICVVSNALILKATYPRIPITVDASCCACLNEETHKAALTVMEACQINVINS